MIKKFSLIVAVALLSSLVACKSDKPAPAATGDEPTQFELGLTEKDTTEVQQLIDRFFDYAKNEDFASAAGMLYTLDEDSTRQKPELLDNKGLERVMGLLRSVPMIEHKIEYMKFNQSSKNEVMCTVTIAKGEDGAPDVTTKMFFLPVNYLGTWCLCLINSTTGDKPVLDPEERDSVALEYKTEVRQRNEVRHQ